MSDILGTADKKPGELLDWDVDFGRWLPQGDYVTDAAVTVGAGTTASLDHVDISDQQIKVWLAGGAVGESATVTVTATTNQGREKVETFRLRIV